jgi:hypothetical protein
LVVSRYRHTGSAFTMRGSCGSARSKYCDLPALVRVDAGGNSVGPDDDYD